MVRTLVSLQETLVQSLVGELRSYKPRGAKIKTTKPEGSLALAQNVLETLGVEARASLWPGSSPLPRERGGVDCPQVLPHPPPRSALLGRSPAAGISQDPPQSLAASPTPRTQTPGSQRYPGHASPSPSLSPRASGPPGDPDILPVYLSDAPTAAAVGASPAEGSFGGALM